MEDGVEEVESDVEPQDVADAREDIGDIGDDEEEDSEEPPPPRVVVVNSTRWGQ